MGLRKFLLILTAAMAMLVLVLVWFLPSSADFQPDNPTWNGLSDLLTRYPASPLWSLSDIPSLPRGASLLLIPYANFTPAELKGLDALVRQGGTLVLADDYGQGNQVLESLGLNVRFSGQVLLDPVANYKNQWFPRISRLEPGPLTANVTGLTLNHATGLVNAATADVLAASSQFGFLDLNGNGSWDRGEPRGALPVASTSSLGRGRVIVIADPSLFINGMAVMEGNRRFIDNIAAGGTLYVDRSHLPSLELDSAKALLARTRSYLAAPAGTFGLVVLAAAIVMLPVWRKKRGPSGKET